MINKVLNALLGVGLVLTASSCEKDSGQLATFAEEGYFQLEVIVNPMIHPYAQSASLAIDEVRIGELLNESLVPDEDLVFDSTAEPNRVQVGSHAVLAPGGYANINIDLNTDVTGCHVSTLDGGLDRLGIGQNSTYALQTEGSFLINSGLTTKRLMLLDLNKLITTSNDGELDFSFRENQPGSNMIKLFDPKTVGRIHGEITRTEATPRQTYRLIVYAYAKGDFNRTEEVRNGFASAEIASKVRRNDHFDFPVLQAGAYDLVVAHYVDLNQDGVLEFKELLQADADVQSDTRITRVSANSLTSIDLTLGGQIAD
ncbi:MAG: hypothetical protein AB8F78_06215 [Saprospiraceae bacterium]